MPPWVKGQSGNPSGRAIAKPFADALAMEIAAANSGLPLPNVPKTSLRGIARALLEEAGARNMVAIKEVIDRTDGKAIQTVNQTTQTIDPKQLSDAELAAILMPAVARSSRDDSNESKTIQ